MADQTTEYLSELIKHQQSKYEDIKNDEKFLRADQLESIVLQVLEDIGVEDPH